jgi:multidrug efflux pump
VLAEDGGPGAAKPVELRPHGKYPAAPDRAARAVAARLVADRRLRDLDDTLPLPGIDWAITPGGAGLARTGADRATIAAMVRLASGGWSCTAAACPARTAIRLRLPGDRRSLDALAALPVPTPAGILPLAALERVDPVTATGPVLRFDGRRAVELRAALAPGASAAEVAADLSGWLAREAARPAGITMDLAGDRADQDRSAGALLVAFAAALGMMILILLALFNPL